MDNMKINDNTDHSNENDSDKNNNVRESNENDLDINCTAKETNGNEFNLNNDINENNLSSFNSNLNNNRDKLDDSNENSSSYNASDLNASKNESSNYNYEQLNSQSIDNEEFKNYVSHKNGSINIQSVPVKRKWYRKVLPYMACTLIAGIIGGVAGGAYINNISKQNTYISPFSSPTNQNSQANAVNYTPSNSLVAKIAADVGPAIVGINSEVSAQGFFGGTQTAQDSGSGIIFDKSGYIVTNQHVIDGGKKITVTLPGGKSIAAQVIGSDPRSDLAVLKINADNLPVAKFGDSTRIRVGDLAIAIGNPMGDEFAGSVTSGIISALNRTMNINDGEYNRKYKLIQTDAAINPGNSGGALINENGEVIGINTIKFVDSKVEGMGFAIPINEAKDIIDQLIKKGYVSSPYLGIQMVTITDAMAKEYNCPAGVGINKVIAGTSAEAAGLKPGDIIIEVDGAKMQTTNNLSEALDKHKIGDQMKLKVWRNGSNVNVTITIGEQKSNTN